MKPIASNVPVGEIVDLSDMENSRVVDLGSVQVGFAQVDVTEQGAGPPATAVPEAEGAKAQANTKLRSLIKDVPRGYAEDLLTDEEIGEVRQQTNRVVTVEVFDVDNRRLPFAEFKVTTEKLDDGQVNRLAEAVEGESLAGARWVVTEIWAHWQNGARRVVLLAKKL